MLVTQHVFVVFIITLWYGSSAADDGCVRKDFGDSSFVCVCNSTYCDSVPDYDKIQDKQFVLYTSNMASERFNMTYHKFNSTIFSGSSTGTFHVNRSERFQSIIGFGGAFTDAASINILSLNEKAQNQLISTYFSAKGIRYSTGRVPMASTDFSTHAYSYDDVPGDLSLTHFSLTKEDIKYKIPVIKKAQATAVHKIKLFASPWTAPAWMKTNNAFTGRGSLIGQPGDKYYKTWANYFVKFLNAYKASGINYWGLTAQNEPMDGKIPGFSFQCMAFSAESQRDFISQDLGPALTAGGYKHVKLMILDDDLISLPGWAQTIYSNASASQYVSGVAVHWYLNSLFSYDRLSKTHDLDPSKFILATEACSGSAPWATKVKLGNWERSESYAYDIIKDLQHWASGWTDWNLALNISGGPNWVNNNVDSPIIVNSTANEFLKQPMFYALGHFSKFLTPGSIRLALKITNSDLDGVAFLTPEKQIVLIVYNSENHDEDLRVTDTVGSFDIKVSARSINTLIWNV